jgi:hypothetical protein
MKAFANALLDSRRAAAATGPDDGEIDLFALRQVQERIRA